MLVTRTDSLQERVTLLLVETNVRLRNLDSSIQFEEYEETLDRFELQGRAKALYQVLQLIKGEKNA